VLEESKHVRSGDDMLYLFNQFSSWNERVLDEALDIKRALKTQNELAAKELAAARRETSEGRREIMALKMLLVDQFSEMKQMLNASINNNNNNNNNNINVTCECDFKFADIAKYMPWSDEPVDFSGWSWMWRQFPFATIATLVIGVVSYADRIWAWRKAEENQQKVHPLMKVIFRQILAFIFFVQKNRFKRSYLNHSERKKERKKERKEERYLIVPLLFQICCESACMQVQLRCDPSYKDGWDREKVLAARAEAKLKAPHRGNMFTNAWAFVSAKKREFLGLIMSTKFVDTKIQTVS
jgi:hypothetical protein